MASCWLLVLMVGVAVVRGKGVPLLLLRPLVMRMTMMMMMTVR